MVTAGSCFYKSSGGAEEEESLYSEFVEVGKESEEMCCGALSDYFSGQFPL